MGPRTAVLLVVVTRRIGDVLLATPLIRSIETRVAACRDRCARIRRHEGVLAANPDVHDVLTVAERPRSACTFALSCKKILATLRHALYRWYRATGRPYTHGSPGAWRAGLVVDEIKHRWKAWLLDRAVPFDNRDTHTVMMHLRARGCGGCRAGLAGSDREFGQCRRR